MASASTRASQGPHFSPHSTTKTNDKSTNHRKNGIWWHKCISGVAFASVHSEKNHLKKLMMIIIMNKLQETMVFSGRQKLTSAMKLRPEKWW